MVRTNFTTIVEQAIEYGKPVRIGVNWGSLDQNLLTEMMDENARLPEYARVDAQEVLREAMIESALRSAALAEFNCCLPLVNFVYNFSGTPRARGAR